MCAYVSKYAYESACHVIQQFLIISLIYTHGFMKILLHIECE